MNSTLKEQIHKRIETEDNPDVLRVIHDLLLTSETDLIYREKLIARAIQSEADIKAGRVYTGEEFKAKVSVLLAAKQ